MTRKQRARRLKRALRVEMTDRDRQMLLLAGLTGYLAVNHLAQEFFPSIDRCQKRLRQLFDARLINLTLLSSNKPNLVSLTPQGLKLIQDTHPEIADRLHLAGAIRLSGVEHHLLVVDTRLYVSALMKKENGRLIHWDNGRGSLALRLNVAEHHLAPDGLAELELDKERLIIALEVDRGTENRKVLETKLKRYRSLFQAGETAELWIIVTGGNERQETLTSMAQRAGLGEVCRMMSQESIRKRPVERPSERAAKRNGLSNPYSASSSSSLSLSYQSLDKPYPAFERRAERTG